MYITPKDTVTSPIKLCNIPRLISYSLDSAHILILRPFLLVYDPATSSYPNRAITHNVALSIITILKTLQSKALLHYAWPFSVYGLVSAMLILWYDLSSPASNYGDAYEHASYFDRRAQFKTVVELLYDLGSTWWAAAAKNKLGEALLQTADRVHMAEVGGNGVWTQQQSLSGAGVGQYELETQERIGLGQWNVEQDMEFWTGLGLDFESDVAGNIFSIYQD